MTAFAKDVIARAEILESQIKFLANRLETKMFDNDISNGLLKRSRMQYMSCFKVDVPKLRQLLAEDLEAWQRETAPQIGHWVDKSSTLRRLPLFGKQVAKNEVNFKFPCEDYFDYLNGLEMDRMPVKLSSINYKTNED